MLVIETTDGYKADYSAGPVTRSKAKNAQHLQVNQQMSNKKRDKARATSGTNPDKLVFPNIISDVEFPGLSDVSMDNCKYPEISVSELQNVQQQDVASLLRR